MTTAFPFNLFSQCLLYCPCTSVTWQGNLVRHGYKYSISLNIFHPQVSSFNTSCHSICLLYSPLFYICSSWTPIIGGSMVSIQGYAKTFVLFSPGNTQICAIYIQPSASRSTALNFMHIVGSLLAKTSPKLRMLPPEFCTQCLRGLTLVATLPQTSLRWLNLVLSGISWIYRTELTE